MKKVKIIFWIIMIILLGVLVYQNWPYFASKYQFSINLMVAQRTFPEANNLTIIAVFFAAGLLIAYLSSLFERFKANKTIKELRSTAKADQDTIGQMRREVESLKAAVESRPAKLTTHDTDDVMSAADPVQPSQP